MKKIFTKIAEFLKRHQRAAVATVCTAIALFILLVPEITFAEEAKDSDVNELINNVSDLFNLLLRLSSAWMWPIILMIGSLLDNDLIFGGAMGERLLSIWVQIRNLVNIVFVLILLAIAVYNVLGLGEEGGGLPLAFKTVMPKFVLALVAVNFSFLAAKVVLDFSNVIAGAVFALPQATIEEDINLDAKVASVICGSSSKDVPMKPLWCNGKELNERAKNFFARLDRSNITLAYALNFGKAHNLKFIKSGIKDLSQLAFNIVFNATIYVVYAVSFIVLFLVLLFRIVVLWVGVVLSPLIALSIVLPNLKELAGSAGELQTKFVKNAMAPIVIGLVLSVGYIMLDGFEADKNLHGEILSSSTLEAIDPNSLPTDITDLQQLMIAVAMVVILWVGVFAGAKDTAAQGITDIIKGHGESFGKWVAKLPMYAQVLPVGPAGEGKSGAQVFNQLGMLKQKWTDKRRFWDSGTSAGSSDLDKAIQNRDPKGIGTVLRKNKHLLREESENRKLKKFAEDNRSVDSGELYKAIENINAGEYDKLIRALHNVKNRSPQLAGALLSQLDPDNDPEKLIREIRDAKTPSEGPPVGPKPPAAGELPPAGPAAAAQALEKSQDDAAGGKAGEGIFDKYKSVEELKKLREAFQEFAKKQGQNLANAALPFDDKEKGIVSNIPDPKGYFEKVGNLFNQLDKATDEETVKNALATVDSVIQPDVVKAVINLAKFGDSADLKKKAETLIKK